MKKKLQSKANLLFCALLTTLLFSFNSSKAQVKLGLDTLGTPILWANSPNSGRLWGYMFGDYYYKSHGDSLARGGGNQYSGIPKNRNAFQFRRIYLGYDYNISRKFAAELLLAAEDNFPGFNPPSSATASGDQLLNNKLTFYIKLANIRWRNIWKGTDFIFGQVATPAFPLLSEKIWNYRSIERTISDIRRTPSYDFGGSLQGVFDPKTKNYGFDLLVGNGTSAKPPSTSFKWFYGDVYAYLFNKKVVVDFYADYLRTNWSYNSNLDRSRQMLKGYIAYNSSATANGGMNPGKGFTIGAEFFINTLKNDLAATKIAGGIDTLNDAAEGISIYVHGDIVKSKLRFFARYDRYNPMTKINNSIYNKYAGNTGNYNDNSYDVTYNANGTPTAATATGDQTYEQSFITAGLDWTPANNVHIMPNIWYEHYHSQLASATGAAADDHDMLWRITFYYTFGK